jgi:HlyD family secretion protein
VKVSLKTLPLIASGAALLALIVYAFLPTPVPVDLAAVAHGPLQVTVDEDGKTRIKERYVVSTPLAGRLLRVELEPGDLVKRGDTLLATIEPNDPEMLDARVLAEAEATVKAAEAALAKADSTLQQAQAELDFAESDVARVRQLATTQSASQKELEMAEMRYRVESQEFRAAKFAEQIARFELEMAKAALIRSGDESDGAPPRQLLHIRAPISGRVLRVLQESATVVTAGSALLEIGDPQDLEVEIDLLSHEAVKVEPGATVWFEQWGGEQPLRGIVRLVEPQGFTKISALGIEEQRVNVIADFVDPPERRGSLGDGYRVEARIVIWQRDDVLKVPTSALFRNQQDWAVFVVQRGRAALRTIQIGQRSDLEAEVLAGLRPEEQVIMHPSDQISDGVAVSMR